MGSALNTGKRRRDSRHTTILKTRITFNEKSYPCQVVNLSETGALVQTPFHAPVGTRADISMPAWPLEVQVVRVTSAYMAVTFTQAVEMSAPTDASPEEFAAIG